MTAPAPAPAPPPAVRGPARPGSGLHGRNRGGAGYRAVLTGFALALPILMLALVAELVVNAWPSITRFRWAFLWTSTWDPVAEIYGAAPMIFGTLVSSFLALVLAVPLALGVAIFLTEFAPNVVVAPPLERTIAPKAEEVVTCSGHSNDLETGVIWVDVPDGHLGVSWRP